MSFASRVVQAAWLILTVAGVPAPADGENSSCHNPTLKLDEESEETPLFGAVFVQLNATKKVGVKSTPPAKHEFLPKPNATQKIEETIADSVSSNKGQIARETATKSKSNESSDSDEVVEQVDEHTAFAHAHYEAPATNATDISVVIRIAEPNQVVTLYLFIFVPLSMAWIYYYYRGRQMPSHGRLYMLLLQITVAAFNLGTILVNQSLCVLMKAPMALTAMQGISMLVFGVVFCVVHFINIGSRPDLSLLKKDVLLWLPAAAAFGAHQLADHYEANFCSLSERTVFGNLAPVLGLFFEVSLSSVMQRRASDKTAASLSSKMALALKVFGASIFALQYPDFNTRGLEVSTFFIISMVIYRLVQRLMLGHVQSPLCVLASIDAVVCFLVSAALTKNEVDDLPASLRLWWNNASITVMLALSFVTFSVGHWATLHLVNTDTATATMVISNIASGFSVFQGILFFHDDDFQRPMAFVGIMIVILAGMWWTMNQSLAARDETETKKQTDDGAPAVSAPLDPVPEAG